MNTNYKAAATKFEIYDSDLQDLIAKIECMDEACVTIDLRGAFNVHSFMQLVPHIADAMRKMELEGDDYTLIDDGADWKGEFERLDQSMQYELDAVKDIKAERDLLQLKIAELTDAFEEMKKERNILQRLVNNIAF